MNPWLTSGVIGAILVAGAIAFLPPFLSSSNISAPAPEIASATRAVPEGYIEYRSGRYGFSLFYPDFLTVKEEEETATSRTIIFEDKKTEAGFQIFVVYYPHDSISEERFRLDIPSGIRSEEEPTLVGGVPAVEFFSSDTMLGETREVWLIKDNYLFEITTYKPLDRWFKVILSTWEWTR